MPRYLISVQKSQQFRGHLHSAMMFSDGHHDDNVYDCFVIEANNPNSAELFAMRWYSKVIGKEDKSKTKPAKCEIMTEHYERVLKKLPHHLYTLYAYSVVFQKSNGERATTFICARDEAEAIAMAKTFGIPRFDPGAKYVSISREEVTK